MTRKVVFACMTSGADYLYRYANGCQGRYGGGK
jgi:hypothetical protein